MLVSDREFLVFLFLFFVVCFSNWDIIEVVDKEGFFFILFYRNVISVVDEIR